MNSDDFSDIVFILAAFSLFSVGVLTVISLIAFCFGGD